MAVLNQFRPGGGLRRARRLGLWWLALVVGLGAARAADTPAPPAAEPPAEYRVKAGFLFNFPQFVEWPARAFPDATAPIIIGVLGEDPFGHYLDELVQGEKIGTHPLAVQRARRIEDLRECHILFICRSDAPQAEKILAQLRGRSVLTVGDDEAIEKAGGIVRFTIENNKVRLRINPEAAKAGELTISSKLLRLATLVPPPRG